MSSYSDISLGDYNSPFLEGVKIDPEIAGTLDPVKAPDNKELTESLDKIETILQKALYDCIAEKENILLDRYPNSNGELSSQYVSKLTYSLQKLEQLMYAFSGMIHYDFASICQYVQENREQENINVKLRIFDDALLIYLPYLPRRNCAKDALVNQMLASAIHKASFPHWEKWTACFYHVFPTTVKNIPKDVDNYDYKRTIDLIAHGIRTPDTALNFDMAMKTVFTDKAPCGVYIKVSPKNSEFQEIEFLKDIEAPSTKQQK